MGHHGHCPQNASCALQITVITQNTPFTSRCSIGDTPQTTPPLSIESIFPGQHGGVVGLRVKEVHRRCDSHPTTLEYALQASGYSSRCHLLVNLKVSSVLSWLRDWAG